MTETNEMIVRILRKVQRTQAEHSGSFDAMAEELGRLREHMHAIDAKIDTLREELRRSLISQNAVLANNSVLIDELEERLAALDGTQ